MLGKTSSTWFLSYRGSVFGMGFLVLISTGPPVKRRAGLRIKQAGRSSYNGKMETTPLRHFLQTLCSASPWNYALLWKLHHLNPMFLTWEDGYCDKNSLKGSDEMLNLNGESIIYDANLGEHPIELAVAYMSSAHYALGEGVVGEVAYTGNYCWVLSDDILGGEFTSNLLSLYPDEWLFQFAAGIKTLLLVPVESYGVLQFGSCEMVAEDPGLVAYIRESFINHQSSLSISVLLNENGEFSQSLSSIYSPLSDNLADVSPFFMIESKPSDANDINSSKSAQNISSTVNVGAQQCPSTAYVDLPEISFDLLNFDKVETIESSSFIFPEEEFKTKMFEGYFTETNSDNNAAHFFSFPGDCELHKALGPAYMFPTNEWRPAVPNEDPFNVVPDDVYCGPDESEKSSMTSSGQLLSGSSEGQKGQSEKTFIFGKGRNVLSTTSSPSASSTVINPLIVEQQPKKGTGCSQVKKASKLSNASKKTTRAGDNQKPRPRDRQLIQDRVKQLRELVPNGSKCSIDGLLERTAKHMLFLRNVTDQAEKLRHSVHHDVAGPKKMKTQETKGHEQSGTSWAFELGSEQQVCPIVVEDLERPGHMLIEMMCNDHWHFLEMADVIHRLDLTILKGAMELHSDIKWAHFIIEAPRGFHRLDIFWPLMRLFQKNRNAISSKI